MGAQVKTNFSPIFLFLLFRRVSPDKTASEHGFTGVCDDPAGYIEQRMRNKAKYSNEPCTPTACAVSNITPTPIMDYSGVVRKTALGGAKNMTGFMGLKVKKVSDSEPTLALSPNGERIYHSKPSLSSVRRDLCAEGLEEMWFRYNRPRGRYEVYEPGEIPWRGSVFYEGKKLKKVVTDVYGGYCVYEIVEEVI
jgi:hypothetical protein